MRCAPIGRNIRNGSRPAQAPVPAEAETAPITPAPEPTPVAQPLAVAEPAPVTPPASDSDGDQVMDGRDLCPGTDPSIAVDEFGCPRAVPIVLRGVNFHTDSDQLTEESSAILDGVAATLVANPEIKLEVSGHTDSDGDDAYNKELSQRRAARVKAYLVEKGVAAGNLVARGYGEEQPITGNETASDKAQNRRVELSRL
jgi:outer membrane protein OmpA-like peptidoglycan-associated protein